MNKKKILVTGDKGFIARKVVRALQQKGHTVIGYDIVDGKNLLDLKTLERKLRDVDIVYHIAASADLTKFAKTPQEAYKQVQNNVEATHNIAYLCAKYHKWLIYASTVCVYGNVAMHPEREDSTLPNPSELYACSKYAAEWIVRGYGLNFNMPWTSLRFATIYGEGMRPALGMHIFFRQALAGEPITVHGNGKQVRTLTFVDDLVEGIVSVIDHPKSQGQVINLSTREKISAREMAEHVIKVTGSKSTITYIPQRINQTWKEDFDVSKAKKYLNWSAKTRFVDGIKKTHEWMLTQKI